MLSWSCCFDSLAIVSVSKTDACFQTNPRPPAEREQSRAVHQLAGCSIRLRSVPRNFPFKANNSFYGFRKLANGYFRSGTNVDKLLFAVMLHQENARFRQVV